LPAWIAIIYDEPRDDLISNGGEMMATDDLQQYLNSLGDRYPKLGQALEQAAKALKDSGTPITDQLLQGLINYNRDFANFQQTLQNRGQTTALAARSLVELQQLYQKITPVTDEGAIPQQVLSLLEQILGLTHSEQKDFAPLQQAHKQAQQLKQQISQIDLKSDPRVKALLTGEHPLNILLNLVNRGDQLNDEQWAKSAEILENAFGKSLGVAISRGKIVSQSGGSTTTQPPLNVTAVERPTANPDIIILEEPTTTTAPSDVIIVPSVEINPKPLTIDGQNIVFGNTAIVGQPTGKAEVKPGSVGLRVRVHLQGLGDRDFGGGEYAGTKGQGRRLEAFQMAINPPVPGLDIQYMAHIAQVGDSPTASNGQMVGEPGTNRQIEGFAIKLAGPEAPKYDVFYNAHIQNKGDVPVCSNGQYCGTRGQSLRVEGIKVWVEPKK
jgi:hypothetical protein